MTFRSAILISTLLHSALLAPSFSVSAPRHDAEEKKPVVIDYVVIKEPKKAAPAQKMAETKLQETPKVELKQQVEMKPPADARPEASKKTEVLNDGKTEAAKKQAQIKSTKDSINYYQFIREKIRQRLKHNYKDYYEDGDVSLTFTLSCDGSLASFDIASANSTGNNTLINIAVSSLKEASPFPPFPKGLSLPKATFDLRVSFRKR